MGDYSADPATDKSNAEPPQAAMPHRFMHVMLRVGDIDRSISFYTERLGMKLLHRDEHPAGRFTLAFLGYGEEDSQTVIELTHNWDEGSYQLGSGYGHIALTSSDIYSYCDWLQKSGVKILRPPGPMQAGPELAFIEDPDGYKIELIQSSETGEYGA
jgi:lactoylglutathione lyase